MKKLHTKVFQVASVLMLTLVAVSCGKSNKVDSGKSVGGQNIVGSCTTSSCKIPSSYNNCIAMGGSHSGNVCELSYRMYLPNTYGTHSGSGSPPVLHPDGTGNGFALYAFTTAMPGDTVTFTGTGHWGNKNLSRYHYKVDEDGVALMDSDDGYLDKGDVLPDYMGERQGLMAASGSNVEYIGSHGSIVVQSAGGIRLGYNIDPSYPGDDAWEIKHDIILTRCVSSSDNIVTCN